MVARPRLVDVACEGPGDQGCVCIGDGDVDPMFPDATVKLGWIGVYGAISVLTVGTGSTTGATVLVCVVGGVGKGFGPSLLVGVMY